MNPTSYKAAIFRGVGASSMSSIWPILECGDDEAIVRNVLTGICGSDIFAYQKHGPESRIWIDEEFGHEAISEVVELGQRRRGPQGRRQGVRQHRQGLSRSAPGLSRRRILHLPEDSAMRSGLQPAADR